MRFSLTEWILLILALGGMLGVIVQRQIHQDEMAQAAQRLEDQRLAFENMKDRKEGFEDWCASLNIARTEDAKATIDLLRQRFSDDEIKAAGPQTKYILHRSRKGSEYVEASK